MSTPRPIVHHGDCLAVLRTLPDESVDAVVTDPPYGLSNTDPKHVAETLTKWVTGDHEYTPPVKGGGFMGKTWDSFVPPPAVWDECMRVLKPGGHLLVFAGTRTQDLMGLSIRLAGFDIRDGIGWIYGSGFPKSMDVSKAIDKAGRRDYVLAAIALGLTVPGNNLHDWTKAEHSPGDVWWDRFKAVLPSDDWARLEREVVRTRTRAATGRMEQGTGGYAFGQEFAETAPATPEAERWAGWGTALKPAIEPVIVARKPIKGTVAANVLAHGTGGINVDATRVASPYGDDDRSPGGSTACTCPSREGDRTSHTQSMSHRGTSDAAPERGNGPLPSDEPSAPEGPPAQGSQDGYPSSPRSDDEPAREVREPARGVAQPQLGVDTSPDRCATCGYIRSTPSMPCPESTTPHVDKGRFPPNVLLDPEAAAAMDEQSGIRPGGAFPGRQKSQPGGANGTMNGGWSGEIGPARKMDSGGASKFFPVFKYQAKAPAKERPQYTAEDGRVVKHATVKPLELMRWLVRLVTPAGGVVLDPFAGSGTTGEAAMLEGFDSILVEGEAEHLPLIDVRIDRSADETTAPAPEPAPLTLFDRITACTSRADLADLYDEVTATDPAAWTDEHTAAGTAHLATIERTTP